MTLATGTKLGRYEIRSKIGAGEMCERLGARSICFNREVSIKLFRMEERMGSSNPDFAT